MTGTPDTDGTEDAIDADFEPAPVIGDAVSETGNTKGGPGWVPFGLVSALALGSLGLSTSNMTSGADNSPENLTQKVSSIELALQDNSARIDSVEAEASASEQRVSEQVRALLAGDDNALGLEALVSELEAVSDRLDDATDLAAIDTLEKRLTALENIDETDDAQVTSRDLRAALAGLRSRVETLETANAELISQLQNQSEALAGLSARLVDLELAPAGAAGVPEQDSLLSDLQAEIDNLKTTVERTEDLDLENQERFAEILSSLQAAEDAGKNERKRDEAFQALREIERRVDEGRSFAAQFDQLQAIMANDPIVAKLRDFAGSDVPSLEQLRVRFAADQDAALAEIDKEAASGWGWTQSVFGTGVKVRRASEEGGPKDQLAAAKNALEGGDIGATIEGVSALPESVKPTMREWLSSAQSRNELEQVVSEVTAHLERQEW